ncbi:MAG: DUF389 domain-containing protein [Leptolyngbyaceae cyanobacterium]
MTQRRHQHLKFLARGRRGLRKFWLSNSGDWQWLVSKPATIASLNRILWRESVPSMSFFVMLTLSVILSTLGLLAGSTATVIGAMIIAPLMGPIIGIAYAITVANRRLVKRALLTLGLATLTAIVSAIFICYCTGLRSVTEEITLRTEPTLIDLFVAMAAGAAGAFSKSRKHIADAFPGVAIAVALVPPLSVIGIGFALFDSDIWTGATLLFVTNLTGIIFSGSLVFLWQRYGTLERAQGGLMLSLVMMFAVGIPLAVSLNNLLLQSNTRQRIWYLTRNELSLLYNAELDALNVWQQSDGTLTIEMEITAPANSITALQVQQSQVLLAEALKRPISLTVQVIPMQEFAVPGTIPVTPEPPPASVLP